MTDIKAKNPDDRRLQAATLAATALKQMSEVASRPENTKPDAVDLKDGVDKASLKNKSGVAASILPDEDREEAKTFEDAQKSVREALLARPELLIK